MPVLIPEEPTFATESERVVWERLRDSLAPEDVLLANLRLTDETKDHEADLVVLLPDAGIVVLEVKGAGVGYQDGWQMRHGNKSRSIDPVGQARAATYALRKYVEQRWSQGRVAWTHGVVTPFTSFGADFSPPELPRQALHDRDDLASLAERIRDQALRMAQGQPAPTALQVELATKALMAPPTASSPADLAEEQEATADRLTQEQASLLKVTRLVPRLEIRGGAGSGKTVLALAQAKQLTRGLPGRPRERVALLCYSLGLAAYLKREVATWPRKEQPAFVGGFHSFGVQWGAPEARPRDDSQFWEELLPQQMAELAGSLSDADKYDSIIVDEAQDFADLWWQPVLKALRDEERGGLYLYSDENQRIYARFGKPPVSLVPLLLDHNLRNTKQIHEAFGPLAPSRMYSLGGDGPTVKFVQADAEEALSAADDEVEALIDEGWAPGDVMLLTTGSRHPEQKARQDRQGQDAYWDTFWDGEDAFYGHVLGAKGLERRAVVLCVNETEKGDRSRERLYVGMSRARASLTVVGDADLVRDIGGPEVAARLGIR